MATNNNNNINNNHLHQPISINDSLPVSLSVSVSLSTPPINILPQNNIPDSILLNLDYTSPFNFNNNLINHYKLVNKSSFVSPPLSLNSNSFSLSPLMALPSPSISPLTLLPTPISATRNRSLSKNSLFDPKLPFFALPPSINDLPSPSPRPSSRTSGFFASSSNNSLSQLIRPPPSLRAASYSSPSPLPHYSRNSPMTTDQLCDSPPSSPVGPPNRDIPTPSPPPHNQSPCPIQTLAVGASLVSPASQKTYILARKLGQGSFSTVFEAHTCPSSHPNNVALKLVRTPRRGVGEDERMTNSVEREVEILKRIRHPNVVELIEEFLVERNSEELLRVLVLEQVLGGELFELVGSHGGALRPSVVGRLMAELCTVVGWMHSVGLVHRDIKLENLLLTQPISNTVEQDDELMKSPKAFLKVTDFGLARFVGPTELLTTRCGSEEYAAPEIILGRPYDGRRTDSWAVGVVGFALITGELPFIVESVGASGRKKGLAKIVMGQYEWKGMTEEQKEKMGGYIKLVEGLLRREVHKRELVDGIWSDEGCCERFLELVKKKSERESRISCLSDV